MSYKKISTKFIEEINSNVTVYEHEATRAHIMTIENDDPNKVFSIAFRTPPINDCGLTHILEHSVLCGSKKYPLKDPFVELLKGSLNTFLNAFTFPDKTMYPCASLNDKDFKNLMSVYLDAVFYPNIYTNPYIFKQEGWHYEMEDESSDITINGVVYNEMKGAYSDPMGVISRYIMHSLFSDNAYGFESGGDPKSIPDLSYEDFKMFHSKYYSPSNSYIMIYGNCDMKERLEFIENEYLNHFDYVEFDTTIKKSKINSLVKEEYYYNVTSLDENQDFLSYNVAIDSNMDMKRNIALDILVDVLFQNPGAPVKEALIKSSICEDVDVGFELDLMEPFLSIVAVGSDKKHEDKFISIIEDTLKGIKLDKEAILAALNFREFKTREAKADGPKGLGFMIKALESWLYDDNLPYQSLETLKYYDELKKDLDGTYFYDLINDCILNNTHKSFVKLLPSTTALESENEILKNKLKEVKASLTKDEIENIVSETKALKKYQETPDSKEAIDTLPKLTIDDLQREPLKTSIEEILGEKYKAYFSDYFTSGILYVDYLFDISDFDVKSLQYAKILGYIYNLVNTRNNTYSEIDKLVKLHTGGITTPIRMLEALDGSIKLMFDVKFSALKDKLNIANDICKDIIFDSIFDRERMLELLNEIKISLEQSVVGAGHVISATRAASYGSKIHYINDMVSGIGYLDFIEGLVANYDKIAEDLINNLNKVRDMIFNKCRMILDFTCEKSYGKDIINAANSFYDCLGTDDTVYDNEIVLDNKNEAIITPYDANYMGKYARLDIPYSGAMLVLKNAIALDYLWQNVRVLGGAYGSMIRISELGHVMLASYRDPNCKRTYDIFENLPTFIAGLNPTDEEMLKYKIGAIGALDDSLHVSTIGAIAFNDMMCGRSYETKKARRCEIIDSTKEEIVSMSSAFKRAFKNNYSSILVSGKKEEEAAQIFKSKRELITK